MRTDNEQCTETKTNKQFPLLDAKGRYLFFRIIRLSPTLRGKSENRRNERSSVRGKKSWNESVTTYAPDRTRAMPE